MYKGRKQGNSFGAGFSVGLSQMQGIIVGYTRQEGSPRWPVKEGKQTRTTRESFKRPVEFEGCSDPNKRLDLDVQNM